MNDLTWLSEAQMCRIEPYFPFTRVNDRRILSGIVFVIRKRLRWRDTPADYGPHKKIYNRITRWSRLGVFNHIFADATHLKAHRTAASPLEQGLRPYVPGAPKVA